jgi:hypothetical protein
MFNDLDLEVACTFLPKSEGKDTISGNSWANLWRQITTGAALYLDQPTGRQHLHQGGAEKSEQKPSQPFHGPKGRHALDRFRQRLIRYAVSQPSHSGLAIGYFSVIPEGRPV